MKTQRGVAATKFEARSSKFETNSNNQNSNDPNKLKIKTGKMLKKISRNRTLLVQRSSIHVVVLLLALVVCLSACAGKSASSKFYVLSPLPQSKLSAAEGTVIGVFPVAMPDYLDRPQIVTRVSENEIKLDEFSRWAEPLKENFYTILVENLSTLLNSEKIVKMAQNLEIPVTLLVGVEVVQFDGTLGGEVVLNVKWGLFAEEGKKLLLTKRSSFREPTGAATYEALVAAQSRAVAALGREIAEAIRTRK
jgi:uncharacterized lipoprotein YmbA